MPGPLEGVKVVEMGVWVAGPAAAAILCDWGADVVKIEPPTGDPVRGMFALVGDARVVHATFDLDNRGKRSLALDLRKAEALAIALQLLDAADVFVTNYRPSGLARLGLDYASLHACNPRLIYCHVTGYGPESDDKDRAAYDVGAFWSRAGIADLLTPPGSDYPLQRGGMGDHNAGAQAAGAVSAALFQRERSGEGQRVAVSLARTGAYTIGWDMNMVALYGQDVRAFPDRRTFPNPLIYPHRCADSSMWLLMLQGDRHWPDFCRAIQHEEWLTDPRWAVITERALHAAELIEAIESVMLTRTRAEWGAIFDRENVWWAPIQTVMEATQDPVMLQAGILVDVPAVGGTQKMVASPADFSGTPWQVRAGAPELGQHTEEVLLELGYDWDRIIALKEAGAIP